MRRHSPAMSSGSWPSSTHFRPDIISSMAGASITARTTAGTAVAPLRLTIATLTWFALVAGFTRLASPDLASKHLFDAWGARDRAAALTGATQAAVDLLLRGERGALTGAGCAPDDVLGAGHYICTYVFDGGAVNLQVQGNDLDGYYVESASFFAD